MPLTPRQNAYQPEEVLPVNLWAVVGFSLYLILASWLFGGVEGWSRAILFYGGVVLFILLFLQPVGKAQTRTYGERVRSLLRFPVFWLGLILFAYVGLQYSNPDFRYVSGVSEQTNRAVWWLTNEGLDPKPDWPTSIQAPTERGNPISFLYRYAGAWFLVLAVRIALTNRREWEWILTIFVANLFVYALVALAQDLSGTNEVLWFREWPVRHHSGVFFYTNHGGAFLYFGVAVAASLLLLWMKESDGKQPGLIRCIFPLLVLVLASIAAAASGSRAAWLGTGAVWAVAFFLVFLRLFATRFSTALKVLLFATFVPIFLVAGGWYFLDHEFMEQRIEYLERQANEPITQNARFRGILLSWDIHQDRPLFGYGADSYGHAMGFYRELLVERGFMWEGRSGDRRRTLWVSAHNDTLQYLVELGWVGLAPILAIWLYWILVLLWNILRIRLYDLAILFGLFLLWLHSFIDLIFVSGTLVILFAFFIASIAGLVAKKINH